MNLSSMSSCRASDGFTPEGQNVQLFSDTEILQGLGRIEMAYLNRRQVTTASSSSSTIARLCVYNVKVR